MEKHCSDESKIINERTTMSSIVGSSKFCRNNTQQLNQMNQRFVRQCGLKIKNYSAQGNDRPYNNRKRSIGDSIFYREHTKGL